MKKTFPLLMLTVIVLLSCKKKNDDPSRAELLTAKSWKTVKLERRFMATEPWTDIFPTLTACVNDNEWSFNNSAVATNSEGSLKCNPADPQVIFSGPWSFSGDEKKILIGASGSYIQEWTIVLLDAQQLVVTFSVDIGPTTTYYRQTMQH